MRRKQPARAILVAVGMFLPLTSCAGADAPATPGSGAASAPAAPPRDPEVPAGARRIADVFEAIDREFVTTPDFGHIRLSALRALASELPPDGYRVTALPSGARIDYAPAGGPRARLTLVGQTARGAALDVWRAVGAAGEVAPEIDPAAREHAMFKRVLPHLDPHSSYLAPADPRVGQEGRAEVGLEVGRRGGEVVVVTLIEGTPAARAGLQPGDRIRAIDGVPVTELAGGLVGERLRGPPGSPVVLRMLPADGAAPRDIALIRVAIPMPAVYAVDMGAGIVRLALPRFTAHTAGALAAELDRGSRGSMRAAVLDLRDNPGGLLTAAVEVAELLLPPGRLVTYTESRVRTSNMRFTARARGEGTPSHATLPIAVLVNEDSAAAAEIVAAAIQDWGRGVLVGARTAGRGSIQKLIPLPSGATLRLTNAFVLTPRGRMIQDRGVTPDVSVPSSADPALDPPLRRAIELLAAKRPNA